MSYIVAYDEQGPIEVEMLGAQPAGSTLIEWLDDAPATFVFGGVWSE